MSWLTDWLDLMLFPSLDWVQVEVTSRCNAACVYCPRTVYRDAWVNRDMTLRTFERLEPLFARTRLVFLQGWGEPLLHPDFVTMVSMAKRFGCQVGTTTNGILLDANKIHELVESGLDVIAVSLADVNETGNDAIRRGTKASTAFDAMRTFDKIKQQLGTESPRIHIAYMLLRSGLDRLDRLPVALQGLGASEVVISTLDFVASKELAAEAILPATAAEYGELRTQLQAVKAEGERCGLRIHDQLCQPAANPSTCTENVEHALFVGADGTVAPCVFSNLPVSQPVQMIRDGCKPYQPVVFGNINDRAAATIWRRKPYRDFRGSFGRGRLPISCAGCPKSRMKRSG